MSLFEKLIGKKQNDESIEKVDENHCLIHPEKEKFAVCHRCHKSFCYDCLIRGVYGDYLCRDCSARSISAGRFGWDYTKKEMIQLLPSDLSYHETLVLEVMCRDCQKEALKELKKPKVPPEMKLERIQYFEDLVKKITKNCPKYQESTKSGIDSYKKYGIY